MTGLTQNREILDRSKTMIAYEVNYYPGNQLRPSSQALIKWEKTKILTKHAILEMCNEERTHLVYSNQEFLIKWEWNNIPTEIEWNKLVGSSTFFVEFRVSPAADGNGKIALIGMKDVRFKKD